MPFTVTKKGDISVDCFIFTSLSHTPQIKTLHNYSFPRDRFVEENKEQVITIVSNAL